MTPERVTIFTDTQTWTRTNRAHASSTRSRLGGALWRCGEPVQCPTHKGITGNAKADEWAKIAAEVQAPAGWNGLATRTGWRRARCLSLGLLPTSSGRSPRRSWQRPGNGREAGPPKRSTACQRARSSMARWPVAPRGSIRGFTNSRQGTAYLGSTSTGRRIGPTRRAGGAGTGLRPGTTCLSSAQSGSRSRRSLSEQWASGDNGTEVASRHDGLEVASGDDGVPEHRLGGQSSVLCPDGPPVYTEILRPHNAEKIQSSRLSIHIFQQSCGQRCGRRPGGARIGGRSGTSRRTRGVARRCWASLPLQT